MKQDEAQTGQDIVLNHALVTQADGKWLNHLMYANGVEKGSQLWGDSFFQIGLSGKISRVNKKTCTVKMDDGRSIRQCPFSAIEPDVGQTYIPTGGRIGLPASSR